MHSTLRNASIRLAMAAATLVSMSAFAQLGMGAWKLNSEKSTFSPGPAMQGLVTYFQPAGDGVNWRSERTGADGNKVSAAYTANFDGTEYPLVGSPAVDAVVL